MGSTMGEAKRLEALLAGVADAAARLRTLEAAWCSRSCRASGSASSTLMTTLQAAQRRLAFALGFRGGLPGEMGVDVVGAVCGRVVGAVAVPAAAWARQLSNDALTFGDGDATAMMAWTGDRGMAPRFPAVLVAVPRGEDERRAAQRHRPEHAREDDGHEQQHQCEEHGQAARRTIMSACRVSTAAIGRCLAVVG